MLSQVAPLPAATAPFEVVLISPYELGRQPFALAEPAALLKREGFAVTCLDFSLQKLDPDILKNAGLVALYVGMHTATRIAVEALPHIGRLAPKAHLCVYGLYAPMNEALLRGLGVGTVLGGELELALVSLGQRLRANGRAVTQRGTTMTQSEPVISLGRIPFEVPDRSGLPKLSRYAHLVLPDGSARVAGFAEGSRGCKHLCRHCPVVPVYQGTFRIVPADVVMEDIRQQVREGATHISFGDPDFFNGPTHGLRLARALHDAFPEVTFDATIKIQHLIDHAKLLPELRRSGCLFITSAVEAVDDDILRLLAKNHTSRDFDRAVALTREAGIALAPTFVAFTPWTRLEGYIALLERLLELQLVESVPPVQLTIRLLVPKGSYLLKLPGFNEHLKAFDARLLGYPWEHPDPRVDQLQRGLQALVARCERQGRSRREVFAAVWRMAHEAAERPAPNVAGNLGSPIPRLSEPWYCCAEPTDQQLQSF
ncbi:CUAEP/CCAEP-tail radical SAM protein [Variovorax sp. LjRoot84]|uniref:CUAEP/CCAEP-tail radical SAM (seleno)protein n=1 Tax=Variovorax sp. LjRoot84 TaxID=3342340 RepID=UPI003ED09A90